jgi:MoxR-like ATPase
MLQRAMMRTIPDDFMSGYIDDQSLNDEERREVEHVLNNNAKAQIDFQTLKALKERLKNSKDVLRRKVPSEVREKLIRLVQSLRTASDEYYHNSEGSQEQE